MKNTEQIKERIQELNAKLSRARGDVANAANGADQCVALQKEARLEGNIGALEWILRQEA